MTAEEIKQLRERVHSGLYNGVEVIAALDALEEANKTIEFAEDCLEACKRNGATVLARAEKAERERDTTRHVLEEISEDLCSEVEEQRGHVDDSECCPKDMPHLVERLASYAALGERTLAGVPSMFGKTCDALRAALSRAKKAESDLATTNAEHASYQQHMITEFAKQEERANVLRAELAAALVQRNDGMETHG